MLHLLTDNQLQEHIMTLKDNIDGFDSGVVFFNAYSLYSHITRLPGLNGLLDELEPYIPLSLNAESLDMFVYAAQKQERMEDCADYFMLKARVDFVNSVQKCDTPERWAQLLSVCGAIRDIKEQLMMLVF